MIAEKPSLSATGALPQKRSLFNKPSWSKPQALSNGAELFHRSDQTYVNLAAEAERERRSKLARKEGEKAHQEDSDKRAGKRRRLSDDDEDEDDQSCSDESSNHSSVAAITSNEEKSGSTRATPSGGAQEPACSPKSLLKRYEPKVAANNLEVELKQQAKPPNIIDLEDDDDLLDTSGREAASYSTVVRPPVAPEEDDQPVSDEEFPELARQAREKARRKRLEEDVVSTTPDPSDGHSQRLLPRYRKSPPTSPPDPILQILITSNIENTAPLIVSRKLSQRLKDVRLAWAERQHFTSDFTDRVFLTWRGKRLFDVTSCKSLGITVGLDGRITTKPGEWEEEDGQIHMEAMTAEMLEAYKNAKRHDPVEDSIASEAEVVVERVQEAQVRLILKAKGFDEFKLKVRPVGLFTIPILRPLMG